MSEPKENEIFIHPEYDELGLPLEDNLNEVLNKHLRLLAKSAVNPRPMRAVI
ncbi:hypothetical protein [Photorhabdus namnaonensis]|uniref:Uncharacterized protein n=1 Tax=Photorhabdus namnaonensis TaxID=1851568 RepID=A0A1B8YCC9_9GAMM|nr:hypothetical protein [Photorhabdus namnaonensis]OCA52786.1 hypothetical protein Phpb_04172 [Photorhabdus namnaonensis]